VFSNLDNNSNLIAFPIKEKSIFQRLRSNLISELELNWSFISRDITVSILPGILFTITALLNCNSISFIEGFGKIGLNICYLWLCITNCCLSNQINSIEEDRHNKPDRPLVRGLVSYGGAKIRWYVVMMLLTLVAWDLGVLWWAIFLQICLMAYDSFKLSNYWATKNILAGCGMISMTAASWQMVTPITAVIWTWLVVLGGAVITLMSIQDLRDMEGDKAIGRSTLPLAIGEIQSRIILSIGFAALPVLIHTCLMAPMGNNLTVLLWDSLLAVISWVIAVRVLFYRSPQADHKSYILFTLWYCLALTSSIFILRI